MVNQTDEIKSLKDDVAKISDHLHNLQKAAAADLVQTNQATTVSLTGATLIGVTSALVTGAAATLLLKTQFSQKTDNDFDQC
tara:strand:- start:159 stop:404 length:246 start_codon:yes stop_codon:yes gene_type:complete